MEIDWTVVGVGVTQIGVVVALWISLRGDHNKLDGKLDRLTERVNRLSEDVAEIRGHLFGVRPRPEEA